MKMKEEYPTSVKLDARREFSGYKARFVFARDLISRVVALSQTIHACADNVDNDTAIPR